jgi:hypothetical protein
MKSRDELGRQWDRLVTYIHVDFSTTGPIFNRLGQEMLAWVKSNQAYLFHATYETCLPGIAREGLRPVALHEHDLKRFGGCLPRVYLAITDDAREHWMPRDMARGWAVLRIKPDAIDPGKVDADPMAFEAIRYDGRVPVDAIEYLDDGQWKPIAGYKSRWELADNKIKTEV